MTTQTFIILVLIICILTYVNNCICNSRIYLLKCTDYYLQKLLQPQLFPQLLPQLFPHPPQQLSATIRGIMLPHPPPQLLLQLLPQLLLPHPPQQISNIIIHKQPQPPSKPFILCTSENLLRMYLY